MPGLPPEQSNTPASTPNIAKCIGSLIEKFGGIAPNSNDICENLDALSDCDIGSGGMLVVSVAESGSTLISATTFNDICSAFYSGKRLS